MDVLIVSAALDTNGQNARFARASARYGDDPSVLRALAVGNADPAGVVARYELAAEKLGGLHIREAHRATPYMDFPTDIVWDRRSDREVRRLAQAADVIHLNNSWRPLQMLGVRKPTLLHHHGSLFRRETAKMLAWARQHRAVSAVSTIDLTKSAPEVLHWLPTAYDLEELARIRNEHRREPDGMVRIVHCPTNRALKGTEALIAAVDALRAKHAPVELVLVEGRRWEEAMAIKATADIVFDQVAFGYGCNAVEAWGMGIPVMAGADDPWVTERMTSLWGGTPYFETSLATLVKDLRRMVASADLRAEWAEAGLAHVQQHHSEQPALARLAELYGMALRKWGNETHYRLDTPVRFRNDGDRKREVVDGKGALVTLQVGAEVETDDLRAAELLRRLAARKRTGVSEVVA